MNKVRLSSKEQQAVSGGVVYCDRTLNDEGYETYYILEDEVTPDCKREAGAEYKFGLKVLETVKSYSLCGYYDIVNLACRIHNVWSDRFSNEKDLLNFVEEVQLFLRVNNGEVTDL